MKRSEFSEAVDTTMPGAGDLPSHESQAEEAVLRRLIRLPGQIADQAAGIACIQQQLQELVEPLSHTLKDLQNLTRQTHGVADAVDALVTTQGTATANLREQGESMVGAISRIERHISAAHYKDHVIRPLANHLVVYLDLLEDMASHDAIAPDVTTALRTSVLQLLAEYGVTAININQGDEFDPDTCRPCDFSWNSDVGRNGLISEVRRPGYVWAGDGEVLRYAAVVVSRCR